MVSEGSSLLTMRTCWFLMPVNMVQAIHSPSWEYSTLRIGGVGSMSLKLSPVSMLIVSTPQESAEAKDLVISIPLGCQSHPKVLYGVSVIFLGSPPSAEIRYRL